MSFITKYLKSTMVQIPKALLVFQGIIHIHLSLTQIINTTCIKVPENECHQAAFTTKESSCEGWICWESQLTLANKRFIISTLNKFRNSIAQNVSNMNKLIWHWALEEEAIRAASTCQRKYLEHYKSRRDIPGLGFSLLCENAGMYRDGMVLPSQTLFRQLFYSFLEENGLYQYDEDEHIRRGNTHFTGCSLVVMRAVIDNSYQNIFAFMCVFCTRDEKLETIYSNDTKKICPPPGTRGSDPQYPNLCSDSSLRHIFLCEPDNPCPDEPRTEIWRNEFEGRVSRLSLLQTNTGPLLLVNESFTQVSRLDDGTITSITTTRTYVDNEGSFGNYLQRFPQIPRSIYFHPQHQAALYNDTLHSLVGPNLSYIYLDEPGVCKVIIPSAATEGSADAFCCFYLMLSTILTTIILGGLFAYTVDHYRKKIQ